MNGLQDLYRVVHFSETVLRVGSGNSRASVAPTGRPRLLFLRACHMLAAKPLRGSGSSSESSESDPDSDGSVLSAARLPLSCAAGERTPMPAAPSSSAKRGQLRAA